MILQNDYTRFYFTVMFGHEMTIWFPERNLCAELRKCSDVWTVMGVENLQR